MIYKVIDSTYTKDNIDEVIDNTNNTDDKKAASISSNLV